MAATAFDDYERSQWAGRAAAYRDSLAALCAYPAGLLLDAAHVEAGVRLLDAGTGTGTVAALACSRAAEVVAVDAEPNFVINHVGDPEAAGGELRRVVRPGGRVAVTIWPCPPPPARRSPRPP